MHKKYEFRNKFEKWTHNIALILQSYYVFLGGGYVFFGISTSIVDDKNDPAYEGFMSYTDDIGFFYMAVALATWVAQKHNSRFAGAMSFSFLAFVLWQYTAGFFWNYEINVFSFVPSIIVFYIVFRIPVNTIAITAMFTAYWFMIKLQVPPLENPLERFLERYSSAVFSETFAGGKFFFVILFGVIIWILLKISNGIASLQQEGESKESKEKKKLKELLPQNISLNRNKLKPTIIKENEVKETMPSSEPKVEIKKEIKKEKENKRFFQKGSDWNSTKKKLSQWKTHLIRKFIN